MSDPAAEFSPEPHRDCPLCPRLAAFRGEWREREPHWHNAPVPTFLPADGPKAVRLLIVGLAPGLRGANASGRPFTGDFAGQLLYDTLTRFGLARGEYRARTDDGLALIQTAITNAVRCVPPQNKPVPAEIHTCRSFLRPTIGRLPALQAILALGSIAQQSTIRALGGRIAAFPFKHGSAYDLGGTTVFASYHCSRYNTNTGVLTEAMFVEVFCRIRDFLDATIQRS